MAKPMFSLGELLVLLDVDGVGALTKLPRIAIADGEHATSRDIGVPWSWIA